MTKGAAGVRRGHACDYGTVVATDPASVDVDYDNGPTLQRQACAADLGPRIARSATTPKWSLAHTPSTGSSNMRTQAVTSSVGPWSPQRTITQSILRPSSSGQL